MATTAYMSESTRVSCWNLAASHPGMTRIPGSIRIAARVGLHCFHASDRKTRVAAPDRQDIVVQPNGL
jgi:hypothetical protein